MIIEDFLRKNYLITLQLPKVPKNKIPAREILNFIL